jgi:hypothetical protein
MDTDYVIVGVMSASFQYPTPETELWVPRRAEPELLKIREALIYNCVGLLKPGMTLEQARLDLSAVQQRLGTLYPATDAGWSVGLDSLKDDLVGNARAGRWLLLGSVVVLLLIACANVACLLLARLNGRAAEIAVRCSLGAGRAAIARQLFAEGLVYSCAGGLLGMAAALAGIGLLRTHLTDLPRITELSIDARLLIALLGVTILTAVLFSLAPILQTFRRDLASVIVRGGRGTVGGRQRLPAFWSPRNLLSPLLCRSAPGSFCEAWQIYSGLRSVFAMTMFLRSASVLVSTNRPARPSSGSRESFRHCPLFLGLRRLR